MSESKKLDDSIYYEKVPGSGGVFFTVFMAIFGALVIIWTLCYATNFVCDFVGIDFNAFRWAEELYYDLPDHFEAITKSLTEFLESIMASIST